MTASESHATRERGSDDYIYVDNEPVLTFWLKIQPDSGSYVSCKRVMVDRAEVGGEYQDMYNTYSFAGNLDSSQFVLYGFYNNFGYGTPGIIWWKEGVNGELDSTAGNWSGGWTESLDLAVWAGHGSGGGGGEKFMAFFVDNIPGEKEPLEYLYWSNIHWGDVDMEWVCIHNCHFLDGSIEDLKKMLPDEGMCAHMICGYTNHTHGYEWLPGIKLAERLKDGWSVKNSWFHQALYHSNPTAVPAVLTVPA